MMQFFKRNGTRKIVIVGNIVLLVDWKRGLDREGGELIFLKKIIFKPDSCLNGHKYVQKQSFPLLFIMFTVIFFFSFFMLFIFLFST